MHPKVVLSSEVDGDEGEPQNRRGVHRESYQSRLVKVLRDLARFEGVHGAGDDEYHVVGERDEEVRRRCLLSFLSFGSHIALSLKAFSAE